MHHNDRELCVASGGALTSGTVILPGMAAIKVYAPRTRGVDAPTHTFAMIYIRDGVEERHEFLARPAMGWQDVRGLVPLLGGADDGLSEHAVRVIERLIRRVIANDDGTPEKWVPNVVDGHFTDPSGDHTPIELLPAYEAFEAGSSRRRWVHLMEHDDEVTVEPDQIVELLNDLVEVASGRPTQRSSP